jgi:hypothetical protein
MHPRLCPEEKAAAGTQANIQNPAEQNGHPGSDGCRNHPNRALLIENVGIEI